MTGGPEATVPSQMSDTMAATVSLADIILVAVLGHTHLRYHLLSFSECSLHTKARGHCGSQVQHSRVQRARLRSNCMGLVAAVS